jgi:hypothetical protein
MHPEYPCAHCIQSGSVASVIKAVLGTVDIPEVANTSPTAPGVTHRWNDEVANARIWAAFHYRFSTRVGELPPGATEVPASTSGWRLCGIFRPASRAASRGGWLLYVFSLV